MLVFPINPVILASDLVAQVHRSKQIVIHVYHKTNLEKHQIKGYLLQLRAMRVRTIPSSLKSGAVLQMRDGDVEKRGQSSSSISKWYWCCWIWRGLVVMEWIVSSRVYGGFGRAYRRGLRCFFHLRYEKIRIWVTGPNIKIQLFGPIFKCNPHWILYGLWNSKLR